MPIIFFYIKHFHTPISDSVIYFLWQDSGNKTNTEAKPAAGPIASVSAADPEKAKQLIIIFLMGVFTVVYSANNQAFDWMFLHI